MLDESKRDATEATIDIKIDNISKLNRVYSGLCWVQGTPWKFQFCKRVLNSQKSLAVYLYCAEDNPAEDWSQAAYASIKLLPYDGALKLVEYNVEPFVFGRMDRIVGTYSLISWHDLFDANKRFVKDDRITLDIKIVAEDTNKQHRSKLTLDTIEKSCADGCLTMFELKISNINNLMALRSSQFQMGKLPWHLTVWKSKSNLMVSLTYEEHEQIPYEITMTTTIVSATKEKKTVEKNMSIAPRETIETILISWEDLIDVKNRFINGNAIVFNVEIKKSHIVMTSCSCPDATLKVVQCPICLEVLQHQNVSTTKCGHIFCSTCITHAIQDDKPCPMCNAPVKLEDLLRIYLTL